MKRLLFDGAKSANLDSLPAEAWTIISGRTPGSDDVVEVVRTVPILQRAVMLVSDAVGSMPFAIMRGSTEIDISAEYKNALGILPNLPSMLSLIETSILMWGAGYWFIGRNRSRKAKEIRYLAPTTIRPIIEPGEGLKGFTRIIGSTQIELATDEVVYFWLPDPSIEVGPPSWSPVKAALRAAGVLGSMDKFTTNFFDRGAIKATLLTVPATTRKADRETLRSWWRTVFGGVKNAFATEVINADDVKPVVIGEGIESLSNAELTREKREDIAVALGIPYSLLFPDAANFATAQQDDRHFYQKTIIPACTTIANVINQQLLESFGCVLEFRPEGLDAMQEDEGNRASAFAAYVGAGLKPSLVAQLLGLELPKGVEYEDLDPEEPEQPEPAQPGQPPLPEQAQEAPEPEEKPTPTKGVDTWAGNAQRESEAASVDLRRWRDKALNALKRGESPAVGFVSTTIPADRWSQVKAALESATTADDVRLAFAPQGPQEGADTDAIKALLEGIRLGVEALKASDSGENDTDDSNDDESPGPFQTARQRQWFFASGPGAGNSGGSGSGKGKDGKGKDKGGSGKAPKVLKQGQISGGFGGVRAYSELEEKLSWDEWRDGSRSSIKKDGATAGGEDVEKYLSKDGKTPPSGAGYSIVSSYQESWASKSNDHGGLQDNLQKEAERRLKAEGEDTAPLDPGQQVPESITAKAVYESVYNRTQAYFKAQGLKPDDTIVVYRGIILEEKVGIIESADNVRWRPLSSWSTNQNTAAGVFGVPGSANARGYVFASEVPVRNIFSHWSTGFGCANEHEVVVLGRKHKNIKLLGTRKGGIDTSWKWKD